MVRFDMALSLVTLSESFCLGPMLRFSLTDTTFLFLVYTALLVRISIRFTAYGVTARMALLVYWVGTRRGRDKVGGELDGMVDRARVFVLSVHIPSTYVAGVERRLMNASSANYQLSSFTFTSTITVTVTRA